MSEDGFKQALQMVLKHEGGFVDNKKDPGGATAYGVSLRFLKASGIDINLDGKIDISDINKLTPDNVDEIYRKYWWDKYRYGDIKNIDVATRIFDMAVNMGAIQAHKLIQKSINSMMPFGLTYLAVDGVLGAKSIKFINDIDDVDESKSFLDTIKLMAKKFYMGLVDQNPDLKIFLKGWLNRLND